MDVQGRMNAQPCQIGSITLAYVFDKYECSRGDCKVAIGLVEDGPRALRESVARQ